MANKRGVRRTSEVESYEHPQAQSALRPDVGTQAQFKKKRPPKKYRYDPSLSPALEWDGQNSAREEGEALLRQILESDSLEEAKASAERLKALSKPFLNWTGKAEHLSFDVPTLPLFVHERLSTQAILETIKTHEAKGQLSLFDLFGDPRRPITDQILRPYEQGRWNNRLILGDSLVAMNSLLRYESLGGQVQMVFIDPPYGVKFGSNFQPFVRKRDVTHGDDSEVTREPEMVQAYRDTWELGLHSYLTYLRDRLLLCRELLDSSGTVIVQISDENLHHIREVMDEVFGAENFVGLISFFKTSSQSTDELQSIVDYLVVYAKDRKRHKFKVLKRRKVPGEAGARQYTKIFSPDLSEFRQMTADEMDGVIPIPAGWRIGTLGPSTSQGFQESRSGPYFLNGEEFRPSSNRHWSYDPTPDAEMDKLAAKGRLRKSGKGLATILLLEDNPTTTLDNVWLDTGTGSFTEEQVYVVQTAEKAVQRCILMSTEPGDLVLDPTCGSGTTAFVAERWGRRWITMDTSRVPLALVRQRLLTATFPYYQLKDEEMGPAGGFVYKQKQNRKGAEVGGIVPHLTLKSIANDELPKEEVLVDQPEEVGNVTRITAPFSVEATIPTPVDWDSDGIEDTGTGEAYGSFVERMIEVLRRSPVLRFNGTRTVTFRNIRPIANTLSLSAEGIVDSSVYHKEPTLSEIVQEAEEKNNNLLPKSQKPVAFVFGPENGAVSEKLVFEAGREANAKGYSHLYVIGFAIQPNARELVENSLDVLGVSATYVQATPDLLMGDLLKNMRSSQIFSVAGLPDIKLRKVGSKQYQVELIGLDTFDPVTMEVDHERGDNVPAWLLDANYNNLCFHVNQAFFPRTEAWSNLKRALKAEYEDSAWDHLAGTTSAPFEAGENNQIAVKVIDDRGNELLVVKSLEEAE